MADRIELTALLARLRTARDDFLRLQSRVVEGEPWPLSETFGVEPEARWGPPEVLAHVAEMVPFWTGEIARVLASRVEPASFGRVASDALRIGLIERDRTLPSAELLGRTDVAVDRLLRRLEALPPDQAMRRGIHPTLGEFTVAGILEGFVVRHLEDHAGQLRSVIGDR